MSMLSRSFTSGLLAVPMLLASPVAHAQAQPAAPRKISLDEAIQLALANNPTLQATRTLIEQSRDEEITANLRPNPVLIWDALFVPLFSPDQLTSDNINTVTEFDLGASYLFERGKKRQHRLQAARDATAVTTSQVADAERALTYGVAQQFIGVLLAESSLDFAKQDLASFQNTVDISQSQYKAGQISEGDFLKIKLQLLTFQTDVSSAQLARVQALVGLRQLLGYQSVPADYDVAGSLAYQPLTLDREHLQALAIQLRPDLRAAVQGVTASQSQYTLAKANGKQDLNFTFDYTHVSGFENGSFTFNLPLAIFNRNQGEIARTRAAIIQAQDSEAAARESVTTDVANGYETVQANGQIVQLYQSGYLDQARQSRDISQYAYERGATSLLDLLDAERSYRAIQLAYLQAEASYQLALEQLREAVGTRRIP
jgi:outer membrane protein, heavy metal efflux system